MTRAYYRNNKTGTIGFTDHDLPDTWNAICLQFKENHPHLEVLDVVTKTRDGLHIDFEKNARNKYGELICSEGDLSKSLSGGIEIDLSQLDIKVDYVVDKDSGKIYQEVGGVKSIQEKKVDKPKKIRNADKEDVRAAYGRYLKILSNVLERMTYMPLGNLLDADMCSYDMDLPTKVYNSADRFFDELIEGIEFCCEKIKEN